MALTENDKQFLLSLLYAGAIILFWRGIWVIADFTPVLKNGFVSFFLGLLVLTLTGYIYKEFDPFGQKTSKILRLLHNVAAAKKEEGYAIEYHDAIGKHDHKIPNSSIKRVEHNFLVVEQNGHELFIPVHRINKVHKKSEVVWQK